MSRTPIIERGVSPSTRAANYQEQLVANEALHEPFQRSEVLLREVPWDNYQSGGILTQSELQLILSYDKKTQDQKNELLDDIPKAIEYVKVFCGLLKKTSTPDTLQYVVSILNEMVDLAPERRIQMLFEAGQNGVDVYSPLFLTLRRTSSDWYINKEISILLTKLVCFNKGVNNTTEEQSSAFMTWICTQLERVDSLIEVRSAVNALQKMLTIPKFRDNFQKANGLVLLTRVVDLNLNNTVLQLLYEVCNCMWLCCYNKTVAEYPPDGFIETLAATVRQIHKEKVRRVCFAALRALLQTRDNRQRMVACQLHREVSLLKQKKWGDPEIEDDLDAIDDKLAQEVLAMSSWDMYRSEVNSGILSWSPVHRSERFWRENVNQFEENNWAVLARLRDLLRNSKDKHALSIACYDLGEFVRYHPRGRAVLNQANVKVDLMQLLMHDDSDVRKNALFSLQKIMAHKVEYIGV